MESMKTLLETYAGAGEDQRLSMFLTHRELRRQFTEIEMAASIQPDAASASKASAWRAWLMPRRWAFYCKGWLRQ